MTPVWHDSLAEGQVGHAAGPLHSRSAVSNALGTSPRFSLPRFAVVQSDRVRGVEYASDTGLGTHLAPAVTEMLRVPITDQINGRASALRTPHGVDGR